MIEFNELSIYLKIYICLVSMIFGMCMGSFLNCCAYRKIHNLSIIKGRSKCDTCGHILGVKDLIPVFSYLSTKGKCRYCGAKLDSKYLISEIVCGSIYMLVVLKYGLNIITIEYLIFVSIMLYVIFTNLDNKTIPQNAVIIGIINRIVFCILDCNSLEDSILKSLIITIPLFIFIKIIKKTLNKETVRYGDIKLIFMTSMYVPIINNILVIISAHILKTIYAYITKKQNEHLTFALSICLGYTISILIYI